MAWAITQAVFEHAIESTRMSKKWLLNWCGFLACLTVVSFYGKCPEHNDTVLALNSDWLEKSWELKSPAYNAADYISKTAVGPADLDVTNGFEVVEFVLNRLPECSTVYPSERYFYFKFYCGHRLISGNLRFCDVENGEVHFGYFDEYDKGFLKAGTLDESINADVTFVNGTVSLKFKGIERTFVMDDSFKKLKTPTLHADEQIVSPILDESGYYLWLVYNQKARRLYYLLDESTSVESHHLISSGGIEFYMGLSSRFVFYNDKKRDRKILVGVSKAAILANNYFDGPFDQVPPDLDIKEVLEHVYPYVKERGGIDNHGNFVDDEHTRVAISPYVNYQDTSEFLKFGFLNVSPTSDDDSLPFLNLVYESKMDFHLVIEHSTSNRDGQKHD